MRRTVKITTGIEPLFGTLDENLKLFESVLKVTTHLDDDSLEIEGEPAAVERAERFLNDYVALTNEGHELGNGEVQSLLRIVGQDPTASLRALVEAPRPKLFGKKTVTPKSANQRTYMDAMEKQDMVFAVGPGGTGKTYLAVAAAVSWLLGEKVVRYLEKGVIEVAPLAFMRGRTLNNSFVILDEAQNTTSEQMKMFLTRLGF